MAWTKGNINHDIPRRVKVYDTQAKKLIFTFESLTAAQDTLGVSRDLICWHIKNKGKCKKNNTGKILAFR